MGQSLLLANQFTGSNRLINSSKYIANYCSRRIST